jgi:hypothetical protein
MDRRALAESNSGWITVPLTGKRKSDAEEALKRGPGRPLGSKNNPPKSRERADSRVISEMFPPQLDTTMTIS